MDRTRERRIESYEPEIKGYLDIVRTAEKNFVESRLLQADMLDYLLKCIMETKDNMTFKDFINAMIVKMDHGGSLLEKIDVVLAKRINPLFAQALAGKNAISLKGWICNGITKRKAEIEGIARSSKEMVKKTRESIENLEKLIHSVPEKAAITSKDSVNQMHAIMSNLQEDMKILLSGADREKHRDRLIISMDDVWKSLRNVAYSKKKAAEYWTELRQAFNSVIAESKMLAVKLADKRILEGIPIRLINEGKSYADEVKKRIDDIKNKEKKILAA